MQVHASALLSRGRELFAPASLLGNDVSDGVFGDFERFGRVEDVAADVVEVREVWGWGVWFVSCLFVILVSI